MKLIIILLKNRVTEILGNQYLENCIYFDETVEGFRFLGYLEYQLFITLTRTISFYL